MSPKIRKSNIPAHYSGGMEYSLTTAVSSISPLAERVFQFIQDHSLVSSGEKVLVGVSGGPDSVCLLYILMELRPALDINVHVAHLDHGLRGDESEADAEYVQKMCDHLGVKVTIERRDVRSYQVEHRLSDEEAAREVRYQFFARVARTENATRVAVGHTADDQVETILMHLVRGAGAYGLQGIQSMVTLSNDSCGQLTVVRPLLEVNRSEVEAYCRDRYIVPRQDTSNLSTSCFRNSVRHELIPLLERYNPNVRQSLLRTAKCVAEDISFIEERCSNVCGDLIRQEGEALVLDSKGILSLDPVLQRYVIRRALRQVLGDLKDIERKHIEKIRAALSLPAGKQVSLPRGVTLYLEYKRCIIGAGVAPFPEFPVLWGERRLRVPGNTELPGWNVEAVCRSIDQVDRKESWRASRPPPSQCHTAWFDLDAIGDELVVRGRRPGDRFWPLGMSEPKKLQDFMVDAHIPRAWRDRIPLVCSPEQIVWVVGSRIDDRTKIARSTRRALRLKFEVAS